MEKIFKPKLFSLLKAGISRQQISADIMSGIVVGIVALPLSIAFAVASGVSPEKGIITAVIAGFIISLLGGSRVQIGGPTGAFIVIVNGIAMEYGIEGLMISTIMAGILLVIFGLIKFGSLLKYIPQPLIIGFTSGIALVIFSTQIKDALGLDIASVPADFIGKWKLYISELHTINPYALIITAVTILIVLLSKKLTSKVPGSIFALVVTTLVVQLFGLPVTTIESFFGEIPSGMIFILPHFSPGDLTRYIQPAITIALLGGIESLLSAVVSDGMISGNHRSNTELIAQGIANIVAPFFGGIPATGAIARTATNVKNGGRTPIAGIIHSLTLLMIMLFLGRFAKLIPMSTLAGILIVVAYNMSEWRSFVSVFRGAASDILILLVTFILTVLVDLTMAIEVGVVLASMLFMRRMADMSGKIPSEVDIDIIDSYSDLPEDICVYEISGPMFFGLARHYAENIRSIACDCHILIIRMRHVPFIDMTGLMNIKGVLRVLRHSGVTVIFSGVNESVLGELNRSGITETTEKIHFIDTFEHAANYALDLNRR